jgi:hypothetical protein
MADLRFLVRHVQDGASRTNRLAGSWFMGGCVRRLCVIKHFL